MLGSYVKSSLQQVIMYSGTYYQRTLHPLEEWRTMRAQISIPAANAILHRPRVCPVSCALEAIVETMGKLTYPTSTLL
jgi:hypothetical protein